MTPLPPETRIPPIRKITPYIPLLGFIVIAVIFAITSFQSFRKIEGLIVEDKLQDLGAIADMKVGQITNWKKKLIRHGETFPKASFVPDEFDRWQQQGMPSDGRKKILQALNGMKYVHGYKDITLFDPQGLARISTRGSDAVQDGDDVALAAEAIRSGKVIMSDIHRGGPAAEDVRIDLVAPLAVADGKAVRVVGALVFEIDPRDFLYPLMHQWPTTSPSAETLLVRREGEDVLFLNELRHRKGAELSLRMPLSMSSLPAAMTVRGVSSSMDGIDYRGIRVISVMRKVPGTSWFMVSKIDKTELLAPLGKLQEWSMSLGLAFALVGGMLAFFWLKVNQTRYKHLKVQHDAAVEREMLVRHFEYLTKYANDVIIVTDDGGNVIEANERAVEVYGYTRDELLRMKIADFADPSRDPAIFAGQVKRLRELGELRFESVDRRKDGSTFPVEVSARVIDVQGKRYLQGIIRDITERRRAEDALRKSEAMLKESQQMAHIGSWELDLVNNVLTWSDENYRIFEIDRARFGASYEAFLAAVHPDDRAMVNKSYTDSVKNKTPYHIVHRLLFHGQRVKYIREWCQTFYDGDGNPLRSIGTTQDITEHNKAEQEYQAILQATTDGFLVVDAYEGRFLDANVAYSRMTGYGLEELLTMRTADVEALETPEQVRQHNQALRESGDAVFETRHRCKDGGTIDVEVSAHYLEIRGGVFIVFIRDITGRKQAERKIVRLNNLYSAISRANEAIARIKDRELLLDEICRIAVEFGLFKLAWIGLVDDATHAVKVVASSGEARAYLDSIQVSIDADKPEGRGPTGMAIRDNREYVRDDFLNDPSTVPWQENARKYGLRSSASCPLGFEGRTVGALTVYADEANYFDQELTNLLSDLSRDISFALDNFARENRRRQAEETLRLSEEKFRTLVANLPQKVFVKDAKSTYSACNALYAADMGIAPDEIAGKTDYDFYAKALAEKYIADDRRIIDSGQAESFEEMYIQLGQERCVQTTKAPFKNEQGRTIGVIGVFWDITDNKRAEVELRKSADEIEDLYDNAPCGYHSLDREGVFVRINNTELQWMGYTRDEVIGKMKITDWYTPRSRKIFEKSFALFKERGAVHDLEVEVVRKDGTRMAALLNATAIYDPDGHFLMSRSTMFDITARKHAEEGLRLHSAIISHMEEGVFLVRASDGLIVYANPKFEQMFGYEYGELLLKHVSVINDPSDDGRERTARVIVEALIRRRTWEGEVLNVKKDGTQLWCHASVSTFEHHAYGTVWISIHQDITEHILAEKRLFESEERFRTMADNAPIIIWIANAGAGQEYMGCSFFNQRWHDFTGLSLEESQAYNWASVIHPGDRERSLDVYIKAFEEAREFKLEYRLRRHDGVFRWIRDSGVPRFAAEGEFLGFIGTCVDITDQKLFEEMRAEIEHIGRLNIAGEMASGLAHELSQPLTAASNYLDGCLHRMQDAEWDQDKLRKAVKLAYLQTERAGSIINHLKELIRKQGHERTMLDINQLIKDSVDFLEHDLNRQSVRVIPHFSDLPRIRVNKIEIEQVLVNLMKNAIDSMASQPRRELHLSTRLVESGNILVAVSDTGKGIPADDLDQVFNPFQTSKQDGLGLGLAICRSLVENHGGRIWAEQNGEDGMEFNFTLPTESMYD